MMMICKKKERSFYFEALNLLSIIIFQIILFIHKKIFYISFYILSLFFFSLQIKSIIILSNNYIMIMNLQKNPVRAPRVLVA